MLRRDRQIRTQIHQLADACLFAFSFWAAFALRINAQVALWFGLEPITVEPFEKAVWLILLLMPLGPLILESQNFYGRPPLCPRGAILWPLLKGCLITTIALVLAMYAFHIVDPRGVMIFFGILVFALIFLKEEILRQLFKSRFGQSQFKRRFILVGSEKEIIAMCREL